MIEPIRIAVASGKGGTGKTTVATSLAVVLSGMGARAAYLDCDVEEPNGHLFLAPIIGGTREVSIPVPQVDRARCTLCGACDRACRHSAIVMLPSKVMTFPKLCHGCGGCSLACPVGAIREVPRASGVVEEGLAGPLLFRQGRLNIGEAMAPPVIRAVLEEPPEECVLVLDAPPGTSCPAVETVKAADVVLLVTEPTPFGQNDLALAVEMVRALGRPFGVVVNRAGTGDAGVFDYCARERIPILLEIPDDRAIAEAYSRGEIVATALPHLEPLFVELVGKLSRLAHTDSVPRVRPSGDPGGPAGEERAPPPSETVRLGGGRDLRELVVVSGKGGTGKTSIVASFFALAGNAAVADCDVDAADLHLVLAPRVNGDWPFSGGHTALIDGERCTGCGLCAERCRFGAIRTPASGQTASYAVDPVSCEGCGVCADSCPERAVSLVATVNGRWFVSKTRHGPLAHARLGIAQQNSGKLVPLVRREGKALALREGRDLLICDGSPGIGCPVIASITGARLALVVTEPTPSGLHDLRRVADLCRQLRVGAGICINKADLNPRVASRIEAEAAARSLPVLGRIRYDASVTAAQVSRRSVVECPNGPAAADIRALWERVKGALS